jgi:hypothetical protein
VFSASIKDGLGHELHRRLFVVQTTSGGSTVIRQPTIFLDLILAPEPPTVPGEEGLPAMAWREHALIEGDLKGLLAEVSAQRAREIETIRRHLDISLNELIHRQQLTFAGLMEQQEKVEGTPPWLAASLKQCEDRLEELNARREHRLVELDRECQCAIGEVQLIGSAWVLPHPERAIPSIQPMVRDEEIERIAVQAVIAHEQAQGRHVESVEAQNRGFDLISRRPHPDDPATAIDVRFIEVKGRSEVGEIPLSTNEYKTAERLKEDYWLYAVFNCATKPEIHIIRNPARLNWKPVVVVEHYSLSVGKLLESKEQADVTRIQGR